MPRNVKEKNGVKSKDTKLSKKENEEKKNILLIGLVVLFAVVTVGTLYFGYRFFKVYFFNYNVDIDGDGWPDLNVDIDNNRICDVNCDSNRDRKPDYNISYSKILIAFFAIDTNGDKVADTNLLNQDLNNDGVCDLNCDVDNDGWPDTNLDVNGNQMADFNIDIDNDGVCDLDCDPKGIREATVNVDVDNDKTADVNIDLDKDLVADINISYNDYTVSVFNIDTNGDKKPDFNLINQDRNNDGICNLNCDVNGDNIPDISIDLDGDGWPDLNIDTDFDGLANINYDLNKNGKPDLNIDVDDDWNADINIDTNNDGVADINFDMNKDNVPDVNVDIDGDWVADFNLINRDLNNDGVCDLNCTGNGVYPSRNIDIDGDDIPDMNIDLNNDGVSNANLDTDNDGVIDRNKIDPKIFFNSKSDIELNSTDKSYIVKLFDAEDIKKDNMIPGWNYTRTFKIKNNTNNIVNYSIAFTDIVNEFSYDNRPNFGLKIDGAVIVPSDKGRVGYPVNNNSVIIKNLSIEAGQEKNIELTFTFVKKDTNQSVDYNKLFYEALKVIIN